MQSCSPEHDIPVSVKVIRFDSARDYPLRDYCGKVWDSLNRVYCEVIQECDQTNSGCQALNKLSGMTGWFGEGSQPMLTLTLLLETHKHKMDCVFL